MKDGTDWIQVDSGIRTASGPTGRFVRGRVLNPAEWRAGRQDPYVAVPGTSPMFVQQHMIHPDYRRTEA